MLRLAPLSLMGLADRLPCAFSHSRSQDSKGIKKPAFYAGLVEVVGYFRMFSDRSNGPGTNEKSPELIDSNMISEIGA